MATTEEELAELREEVRQLRHQQDQVIRTLRERGWFRNGDKSAQIELDSKLPANERVKRILRQKGMLVDLPPEAQERIARWRALPEEERQKRWDEFYNLKLDKPLSDIVIENRR